MRGSISIVNSISTILILLAPFLRTKRKKYSIAIFPFTQKGSDGYTRRIAEYLPFLERDKISFQVFGVFNNNRILEALQQPHTSYLLYATIPWIRLFQVLKASSAEICFVQRSLFPYYPDQKFPFLERLLHHLNKNVIIDVWDAVWIYQPNFAPKVPQYCSKISVVNSFLKNYYSKKYPDKEIVIFPIGVNLSKYKVKTNYNISNEIKLFYTGAPYNVKEFINITGDVLRRISAKHKIKLVCVCREALSIEGIHSEFHKFDENTFFEIMQSCDIGVYAFKKGDEGMGKMAMKVLDYMAAGLPVVASDVGLSPYINHKENIYVAADAKEWETGLELLINSKEIRENLGSNAQKTMKQFHSIDASYVMFKKLTQLNNARSV